MPAAMSVSPECLAAWGARADALSGVLRADHHRTAAATTAELPHWGGRSGAALAAAAAQWTAAGDVVAARIAAHAEALRRSARVFAEMDRRHAAVLTAVASVSGSA